MRSIKSKPRQILRVAVVSDLHAYEAIPGSTSEAPSYLRLGTAENEPTRHPISGLIALLQEHHLTADLLLCCGDMGDRARPSATQYAWAQLQRLKIQLQAELVATPGNHDMDSRHSYNSFDARGVLQGLDPPFPFSSVPKNDEFWSRNFVILAEPKYRLVVINSSAYHGGDEKEFQHGRISASTLERLRHALRSSAPAPVNIALFHHHPQKYGDISIDDYTEMLGGEGLLQLFSSGDHGRWFIVHGHKHHPRLCYGPGSGAAPIILSAGSLCAHLYSELQGRARNQFYFLEFPIGDYGRLKLELAARFQAWDWISELGWRPAGTTSGLPGIGGFGYRPEMTFEARRIATFVRAKPYVNWNELRMRFPSLDFLLPDDIDLLRILLDRDHSIDVNQDSKGQLLQLAMKA